jgi:hypothetical protein
MTKKPSPNPNIIWRFWSRRVVTHEVMHENAMVDNRDRRSQKAHARNSKLKIGGRFLPGQSGNPAGRPADKWFRQALLLALAEGKDPRRTLRGVAEKLIDLAVAGDVSAIKEIIDRVDGKVPLPLRGDDDDRKVIVEIRKFDKPASLGGPVVGQVATPVIEHQADEPERKH